MPRLRLVGDSERNPDVLPFPMDRVRRVSRHGEGAGARLREPTPIRARSESIEQVERAVGDVQKNVDELVDLLAPLPFDRFARERGGQDFDRPWAA